MASPETLGSVPTPQTVGNGSATADPEAKDGGPPPQAGRWKNRYDATKVLSANSRAAARFSKNFEDDTFPEDPDQVLAYEPGHSPWKLMELDPAIMEQLKQGKPLYVKNDGDECVLVSATDTYAMRFNENSNTLLAA